MPREKPFPMWPDEARDLNARVFDLSETGAKQALLGMIKILTMKTSIAKVEFKNIVDDAGKYSQVKKQT